MGTRPRGHARLVSVIVPAYKAEATIDETLQSVRSQTYPHLDVIVVDDGSTIDHAGCISSHGHRPTESGLDLRSMCHRNIVGNGSAAMMRRADVLELAGYDPTLRARGAQGRTHSSGRCWTPSGAGYRSRLCSSSRTGPMRCSKRIAWCGWWEDGWSRRRCLSPVAHCRLWTLDSGLWAVDRGPWTEQSAVRRDPKEIPPDARSH